MYLDWGTMRVKRAAIKAQREGGGGRTDTVAPQLLNCCYYGRTPARWRRSAWQRQLGGGSLAAAAWRRQLGGGCLAAARRRQQGGGGSLAAERRRRQRWKEYGQ